MDIESTLKSELLTDIGKIYDRINNLPREIDGIMNSSLENIEARVNALKPEIEDALNPGIDKLTAVSLAVDQAGTAYRNSLVEANVKFREAMIEIISNNIQKIAQNAINMNKDIIGEMVQQKVASGISKALDNSSIERIPEQMKLIFVLCGFSFLVNLFLVVFLIKHF